MRYGIFSDVHSNLEALDAVLKAYSQEKIDQYLCVGDVVGYAADPKACIDKVKAVAMLTVAGNHDWASIDLFSADYFNPVAKKAILWTKHNLDQGDRDFLKTLKLTFVNQDLTLVHATLDNPEYFYYMMDNLRAALTFGLLKTNLCFVGHSHIAGVFAQKEDGSIDYLEDPHIAIKDKNKYIINAGSVGQPRDGDPRAAYCIYDSDKKEAWIKRASYDVAASAKKVIDAGLPKLLAERLSVGR